MYKFNFNLVD